MATLVAQETAAGSTEVGYSDGSVFTVVGSLSPDTFSGIVVKAMATDPGSAPGTLYVIFPGGTTEATLTGSTVTVDSNSPFTFTSYYDFGSFVYGFYSCGGFSFANGSTYTVNIDFGGAPVEFAGPTFAAAGSGVGGTAGITVSLSSIAGANRRLFIGVMTANQTMPTPSGWNLLTPDSGTPSRGTAGAAGGVKTTVFWKDSDGTETTQALGDSGNVQYAVAFAVDIGAGYTVDFDGVTANNDSSSSAVFVAPATTGDNRLAIVVVSTDRDGTGATWTLSSGATKQFDDGTSAGNGGGVSIYSGQKSTSGTYLAAYATQSSSLGYAYIGFNLYRTASGSTITGTLAATESSTADTFAASGTVTWPTRTGTLAATESATADSASLAGTVDVAGTLAATESSTPDSLSISGTVVVTGTLDATESATADTLSATGTVTDPSILGDLAATESSDPDTADLSGQVNVNADLAATEPADPDTLLSDGYVEVTATLATTESTTPDTLAATGSVAWPDRTGTLDATESTTPDSAAITGTIAVIGDLAATEPADEDTFESTGYVTDPGRVAIMAATESATPDAAAFAGTVSVSGSLAATDPAPDSAALIGQVNVTGTLSAPEVTTPDSAALTGTVTVTAALTATESTTPDTAAITGSVYWTTINGTLASVEDSSEDSAAISATVAVTGTLDASETGSDAFAASGQVFFPGRTGSLSVIEDPTGDSAALSGSVSISGQLAVIESLVDGMAAAGEVAVTGTLSSEEPTDSDSAEVTGSVYWQPSIGTLDATEDPTGDSASASGVVLITITADIVETEVDVFSATLYTSLQAVMAAQESGSDRFLGGRIHATSSSIPQVRETASRLQIRSTESEPQVRSSESEAQDRSSSSVAME